MTPGSVIITYSAGLLFDSIADHYDEIFTDSLIGRAQRDTVWDVLRQTFRPGEHVLELNCGTGEDALFLSRMGVSVYGCDASERMIAVAARRMASSGATNVELEVRRTEEIGRLRKTDRFDGVLSNFGGLNCVANLSHVAEQLGKLTKPGGRLVLCLCSRFCLWETLWYITHGRPARACRRWKGSARASLGAYKIDVWYPTVPDILRNFARNFVLRKWQAVGLTVPPSYLEHVARRSPRVLKKLQALDRLISSWPGFRLIGDHTLLVLEREG